MEVTAEALAALARGLEVSESPPNQGLRLACNEEGRFALVIDRERAGDRVLRYGERLVLLIGREVASALEGAILEVIGSPEGKRLTLRLCEGA